MNRTILLLPLLLLPMGCSLCADPLFQTVPVAGDADGLRKFAGEWFDEEGNLIAVISTSPEPQLSVQTPKELEPKGARLLNREIVFRLATNNPEEISFRLTGEDEISVAVAEKKNATCGYHPFLALVLVRDPSPAWQMELALRKGAEVATELANTAYDRTMDRLVRVL
jgi:hypothetical protein